jgi:hypothetical protein
MVARLNIAAGDTSTNAAVNAFIGLSSAEQQLIYLMDRAVAAQLAFNTTEPPPETLINRVAVVPGQAGMAAQLSAPLANDAPTGLLWDGCLTIGVSETPIAAAGGNVITDPSLSTLLAIPTLTGQIVYLAALIETEESDYNQVTPEATENRIQLSPNFDQRVVGVSAIFPLAGSGNAALVGALPY